MRTGEAALVTIFVRKTELGYVEKYDKDDACMKTAIASYEIIVSKSQDTLSSKIVLHLRKFTHNVRYDTKELFKFSQQEEADVACLAVESVLKTLNRAGCVARDVVPFQYKKEGIASNLEYIVLNQQSSILSHLALNPLLPFGQKNPIISHAYAYLNDLKLYLFLRDTSSGTIARIDSILSSLFPKVENSKSDYP